MKIYSTRTPLSDKAIIDKYLGKEVWVKVRIPSFTTYTTHLYGYARFLFRSNKDPKVIYINYLYADLVDTNGYKNPGEGYCFTVHNILGYSRAVRESEVQIYEPLETLTTDEFVDILIRAGVDPS